MGLKNFAWHRCQVSELERCQVVVREWNTLTWDFEGEASTCSSFLPRHWGHNTELDSRGTTEGKGNGERGQENERQVKWRLHVDAESLRMIISRRMGKGDWARWHDLQRRGGMAKGLAGDCGRDKWQVLLSDRIHSSGARDFEGGPGGMVWKLQLRARISHLPLGPVVRRI